MAEDNGPSFELQAAIYKALKASAALKEIVGDDKIFDHTPRDAKGNITATMPFVSIGEDFSLPFKAGCLDAEDVTITIHAWSAGPGFPEVKRMTNAIKAALDGVDLIVAGHRLTDIEVESVRHLPDPDGITRHGVVTFLALIEPA